ncbi:acetyl-CoA carboxylase carboxyltransferase subunit alpha [Anaerobranca californiensis DSM 14826]|jgi:acetyl-CoA carboxylase carboxyl transferase subunit alpha|uniref:Acetyl-coenzyme A carboxylase carboxyl transferase subunit alpha n=1 Tax=Anaerobranca californiensis DSM 14826 TaxID=1120989 RepID=A0A1M6PPR8_9FIRM|nr:acetyl-CoA carboxylase carboxyltransferase subunit alpha [Anaerobranca californiensis]SHK09930.1 acetyl-CoA carboxylase carboxyltransferase subunit alpha [Anaerobranca californiensis DSM 14826]
MVDNLEQQLNELEKRIKDLKEFALLQNIDLNNEIELLEKKAFTIKQELYRNLTPWQKVQIARHNQRPTTLQYIKGIFQDFIQLHGDRYFKDDPAIVGGIARLGDTPVTVIGHQKGKDTKENIYRNFGMPHPEGYRKALRLMKQGEKFKRPIITFIDTPGAYPGLGAEERGQGEAIAKNLMEMSGLKVPIIVIVTGEGGSGGALALGVGDSILMMANSVYSVISPEGCAAILWKDATRAKEAADALKLTADDLYRLKIIDEIIPEPQGGAHKDIEKTMAAVKEGIERHLDILSGFTPDELVKRRYQRLRKIGEYLE